MQPIRQNSRPFILLKDRFLPIKMKKEREKASAEKMRYFL